MRAGESVGTPASPENSWAAQGGMGGLGGNMSLKDELRNELRQDLDEALIYLLWRNANALLAIILELLDILSEMMEVSDDDSGT